MFKLSDIVIIRNHIISYQYVDLTSCHDCLYWHVGFVLAMCTLAETEEQGKNSKVRRYSHG